MFYFLDAHATTRDVAHMWQLTNKMVLFQFGSQLVGKAWALQAPIKQGRGKQCCACANEHDFGDHDPLAKHRPLTVPQVRPSPALCNGTWSWSF